MRYTIFYAMGKWYVNDEQNDKSVFICDYETDAQIEADRLNK